MSIEQLKTPEEILEDNGYSIEDLEESETMFFRDPDFSTAIVGVDCNNRVVYDYEKMLDYLVVYENMTYEDAADFISYDTLRALAYWSGNKPVVMFPLIN